MTLVRPWHDSQTFKRSLEGSWLQMQLRAHLNYATSPWENTKRGPHSSGFPIWQCGVWTWVIVNSGQLRPLLELLSFNRRQKGEFFLIAAGRQTLWRISQNTRQRWQCTIMCHDAPAMHWQVFKPSSWKLVENRDSLNQSQDSLMITSTVQISSANSNNGSFGTPPRTTEKEAMSTRTDSESHPRSNQLRLVDEISKHTLGRIERPVPYQNGGLDEYPCSEDEDGDSDDEYEYNSESYLEFKRHIHIFDSTEIFQISGFQKTEASPVTILCNVRISKVYITDRISPWAPNPNLMTHWRAVSTISPIRPRQSAINLRCVNSGYVQVLAY